MKPVRDIFNVFDYDFWNNNAKCIEQRINEELETRGLRIETAFEKASENATLEILKYFANLYLGIGVEQTNNDLLCLFTAEDNEVQKQLNTYDHWCLWTTPFLYRLYFNFGSKSKRMPGRLKPETERALLELLWKRTALKNDINLTRQSTWWMGASENHDINAKVSSLLSSQIFMHEPGYLDNVYPDIGKGGTSGFWFHERIDDEDSHGPEGRGDFKTGNEYKAKDHYAAWVSFWMEYISERAKKGFFVEVASPSYMKWTVTFLYDIYDFCENEILRMHAKKFLDLIWAEWVQDQLSGRRGGAKTRRYDWHGPLDSMYTMILFLLGGPGNACHAYYNFILSEYRLPEIIWKMALDREKMGSYEYISRKPGEEANIWPRPLGLERSIMCDTESRFVRYSWVTPYYILGTQMDHPACVHSHLSMEDRWQGIMFNTTPEAMIFPGGIDTSEDGNWEMKAKAYRSVQYKNILITQQNRGWTQVDPEWFPTKNRDSMQYGIFFGEQYEHMEEKDGWIFLQEGKAYLAVKAVIGGCHWNKQHTIACCEDRFSPIIFHASCITDYDGIHSFMKAILSNPIKIDNTVVPGWRTMEYTDLSEEGSKIYFNAANNEIPMINGEHINYTPGYVFFSPYIESSYNSGIVTVKKEDQQLILDFN